MHDLSAQAVGVTPIGLNTVVLCGVEALSAPWWSGWRNSALCGLFRARRPRRVGGSNRICGPGNGPRQDSRPARGCD